MDFGLGGERGLREFWVQGLGFRDKGLGFRDKGLGFRDESFRAQGLDLAVRDGGLGLVFGFGVQDPGPCLG